MASVIIEIIASIAEAGAVTGEVAADLAVEEVAVISEVGESAAITEGIEATASVEIESVVADMEISEVAETIGTEVEELTSEVIETDIESTVDETVANEVTEEAAGSSTGSAKVIAKTLAKWLKRLDDAYTIVDMVGNFIYNLVHPAKPPTKPLSQEQQSKLTAMLDAANKLKSITHSWQEALQPLENIDLGSLTVDESGSKTITALVTDTVDGLINRSQKALNKLKPLTTSVTNEWNDTTIQALYSGLYQAICPLDAICYLKSSGKAKYLKLYKFPSDEDCKEITDTLHKDFDFEAKKKAMQDVMSTITEAVKEKARVAGVAAATTIIRPDAEARVKSEVKAKYGPEAKEKAKSAAKSAAQGVANSYRGEMIAYAFIPIYGIIKVQQLKKEAQAKAKVAAEAAAKKTVSEYMNSTEVETGIQMLTKAAVSDIYNQRKSQITNAVKNAASVVIKQALNNKTTK